MGQYGSASLSHSVYFALANFKPFAKRGMGNYGSDREDSLSADSRKNYIVLHVKSIS
jgi:hypothetical protein